MWFKMAHSVVKTNNRWVTTIEPGLGVTSYGGYRPITMPWSANAVTKVDMLFMGISFYLQCLFIYQPFGYNTDNGLESFSSCLQKSATAIAAVVHSLAVLFHFESFASSSMRSSHSFAFKLILDSNWITFFHNLC